MLGYSQTLYYIHTGLNEIARQIGRARKVVRDAAENGTRIGLQRRHVNSNRFSELANNQQAIATILRIAAV